MNQHRWRSGGFVGLVIGALPIGGAVAQSPAKWQPSATLAASTASFNPNAPLPPVPAPYPRGPARAVALPSLRSAGFDAAPSRPALDPATLLRLAMMREVPGLVRVPDPRVADWAARAQAMLSVADQTIEFPQVLVVVDRNPAVQTLSIMLARPGERWSLIGATRVSTGQAGRKDYYITPVGAFAHTDAILDFRAAGTYNENHIRGLGVAGMRVWDFGWQWALKGWQGNGQGGDIRLQLHATDPDVLEPRLGHPASEGCIRVSSAMNRFLDRHGVLDADYERAASQDDSFRSVLAGDRVPNPLAGRLLVIIDTRDPPNAMPTALSRPADWPSPG